MDCNSSKRIALTMLHASDAYCYIKALGYTVDELQPTYHRRQHLPKITVFTDPSELFLLE